MDKHPQSRHTPERHAKQDTIDRRRNPRRDACGEIVFLLDGPRVVQVWGELRDISATGFRVEHGCLTLASGIIVPYVHPFGNGRARVIWTRVLGDRAESGFLVIDGKAS